MSPIDKKAVHCNGTLPRFAQLLLVAIAAVAWVVAFIPTNDAFTRMLGAPVGGEQHDRFDSVGLAFVARRTVRLAQLGEFFGGKRVVEHAAEDKIFPRVMPDS